METRKHPILVVDDEADILFSLQALLRRNFEVYTAEGGSQALDLLRQHHVHVIMTDQRMPEMTGVELLRHARGICPETIRILFTGYADLKAVVDAVNRVEIFRYLTKPWDPDELHGVLEHACAHYEWLIERSRLLADLRSYLAQWLAVPGERNSEQWIGAGAALLERVDRAADKKE